MKKNILFTVFITFLCFYFSNGSNIVGSLSRAHAQQDWKQEYAAVCSKTQNAMTLSVAELKDHIERCDKLQDRINELNGSPGGTAKKVYTKRLKMCRDLYKFTLEHKDNKE